MSALSFVDHGSFVLRFDNDYEVSILINVLVKIASCLLFEYHYWSFNFQFTIFLKIQWIYTQVKSPPQNMSFVVLYGQIIFAHSCNKFVMTGTSNKCWQLPITERSKFSCHGMCWKIWMPKSLYWLCSYVFVLLNMLFMMSFCKEYSYRIAWVVINYSFSCTHHRRSRGFEHKRWV